MTKRLVRGENFNLSKEINSFDKLQIQILWEEKNPEKDFDLDVSAFLLNDKDKVRTDNDFIFYNCLKEQSDSCVIHQWNNIKEKVDKEVFTIFFKKIPAEIKKIAFTISIYNGAKRKQNFNYLNSAIIKVIDFSSGEEIVNYNFTEDKEGITAMIFGELYLYNNDWKFKAIGQGFSKGLIDLEKLYGVGI